MAVDNNKILKFLSDSGFSVIYLRGRWACFALDDDTFFDVELDTIDGTFRNSKIVGTGDTLVEVVARVMEQSYVELTPWFGSDERASQCRYRHVGFDGNLRRLRCPQCGDDCFYRWWPEGSTGRCDELHEDDRMICDKCNYETTGKGFVEVMMAISREAPPCHASATSQLHDDDRTICDKRDHEIMDKHFAQLMCIVDVFCKCPRCGIEYRMANCLEDQKYPCVSCGQVYTSREFADEYRAYRDKCKAKVTGGRGDE